MSNKQKKGCKSYSSSEVMESIQHMVKTIQNDLNELKDNIYKHQNQIEESQKNLLNKYEKQTTDLTEVLAQHNACLKSIISSFWKTPRFIKHFPIKCLQKWEEEINEENKDEMVKTVTAILGKKGIKRGLHLIVSPESLLNYNLNGSHNKKRLKNLKNIMDVFFLSFTSTSITESEPDSFEKNLRLGIKVLKNKHFKDICLKNKDEKENNKGNES